jgi:CRISPR type III-A-associated RAMP protein Csm5
VPDPLKATSIYCESLLPNKKLKGRINISNFLLKSEIRINGVKKSVSKLLVFDNRKDMLYNFSTICNNFAKEFINRELDFFKQCKQQDLVKLYNQLLNQVPSTNSEFLLHLGWGSGWHGMTIGVGLDHRLKNKIRKHFRLGKCIIYNCCAKHNIELQRWKSGFTFCPKCNDNLDKRAIIKKIVPIDPFPKTRKIVFVDGKPKYPLGWVKITLET